MFLFIYPLLCAYLQAIETFAVTVKEIAQVLQGFGSELSETDLPDEANAIEFLLRSHTHRYRQMKVSFRLTLFVFQAVSLVLCGFMILLAVSVICLLFQDDIRNVLKEGHLLLSNLETVKASKRDMEEESDIRVDMDTVQR